MGEVIIEYDDLGPDELIKAINKLADHEALHNELKAGSEKKIWSPNEQKSLANLEGWATEQLINPLERFRRFFFAWLGLKLPPAGDWVQYVGKNQAPLKKLQFPHEINGILGVSPMFQAKLNQLARRDIPAPRGKLPVDPNGRIKLSDMHLGIKLTGEIALTPAEKEAAKWATRAAGLKLTQWADTIRNELRWEVAQAIRKRLTPKQLEQILHDRFEQYAADLRRVAITELNDAYQTGYLLTMKPGVVVEGVSAPDACSFCQEHINGKRYVVSHKSEVDEWKYVWPGKTNFGRKRQDWVPTIPSHPLCRCRWVEVS